jgi:predicted nucleic acid-binding Zn ribbon protein
VTDENKAEEKKQEFTAKIPQHRHCRRCGKAFVGEGYYCSEECKELDGQATKKKLYRYIIEIVVLWAVVIAAVLVIGI